MTASIFFQSVLLCHMPAVWLKVVSAVGDLVCCEILMILIKITHCWQSLTQCNYRRSLASIQCLLLLEPDVFLSETACLVRINRINGWNMIAFWIGWFSLNDFGLDQAERFLSQWLTDLFNWEAFRHFEKHAIFTF